MTTPYDPNAPLPSDSPGEPAVASGSLVGAASLIVSVLVSVGVPLDASQKVVIIAAITFIAPIIAGVLIRAKVFSPQTYYAVVEQLTNRIAEARQAVTEAHAAMNAQDVAHSASLDAVKAAILPVMSQMAAQVPQQAPQPPQQPYYAPQQPWSPQPPAQAPQQPTSAVDWAAPQYQQPPWASSPYDVNETPQQPMAQTPSPRPAVRRHRYLDENGGGNPDRER